MDLPEPIQLQHRLRESRRFVFILWKSRRADDFDFYHSMDGGKTLRGVMSARGVNEIRFKVFSKYGSEMDKYGYDRMTVLFGDQTSTGNATCARLPLNELALRIKEHGY